MASASDVPHKFDVVLNGEGYRLADTEQIRARYGYTPTFVQRLNIEGDYSDNQQDFWLTSTQRDWSGGGGQKFYRPSGDAARKFWNNTGTNIRVAGEASLQQAVRSLTFAAAVRAVSPPAGGGGSDYMYAAGTTNLYRVAPDGTLSDLGAHGLGVEPGEFGMVADGNNVFLSSSVTGTVGVRQYDGSAFSTFSASGADSLAYLNNTLYGYKDSTGELVKWDTAGTQSVVYEWSDAGGAAAVTRVPMRAFGGKLMILRQYRNQFGSEMWIFDGAAPAQVADFPVNFFAWDIEVSLGITFISGVFARATTAGSAWTAKPAIFFYVNNSFGKLWEATSHMTATGNITRANAPALCSFDNGLLFTDDTAARLMFYDIETGSISSVGDYTAPSATTEYPLMAGGLNFVIHTRNSTAAWQFPNSASVASSGTVTSSLIDFDSSLDKYFKSVVVDADLPSGATVDIAYRLNDLDGAYTTLQTGAVSGTEYDIDQSGRSISIKLTLNKGASTSGPKVKRVHVRAVPLPESFKRRVYTLDLSGRDGESHIQLRDGSLHTKDGAAMAADLNTAATAVTPISITDKFGTFTGVIEAEGYELVEIRPDEYVASVRVREV